MGLRGPQPTPTKVLKMRGSWLAKRNPNEPKPEMGIPKCPKFLKRTARKAWKILAPQLDYMGVLAKVDQNVLTMYCQLYTRWIEMENFIASHNHVYPIKETVDVDGKIVEKTIGFKIFPQVRIASDLVSHLTRLGRELGLSPSARAHLTTDIAADKTENQDDSFFKSG